MKCYRCDLAAPYGSDSCRSCGSVAFYHGARPQWPPQFQTGENRYAFGAFLLGDIPAMPTLKEEQAALLAIRQREQEANA